MEGCSRLWPEGEQVQSEVLRVKIGSRRGADRVTTGTCEVTEAYISEEVAARFDGSVRALPDRFRMDASLLVASDWLDLCSSPRLYNLR